MKLKFHILTALVLVLSTTLGLATGASADAPPAPTIVVVDTGFDPSNTVVASQVVYEVCVMSFALCPNGKDFMEGPSSAALPKVAVDKSTFYHGTQMSSLIVADNPSARIIEIRVVANTPAGYRASTRPAVLGRSLQWVADNAAKFNIVAVTTSQGTNFPKFECNSDATFSSAIDRLTALSIPAFYSAGNDYDYKHINWPACDPRTVSVGGLDYISNKFNPSLYSNYSPDLDFSALGKSKVINAKQQWEVQVGTSVATAAVASRYYQIRVANPGLSEADVMAKFKAQSFLATSSAKTGAFKVNALNLATLK